jgi:Na+/proline symporter
MAGLGIWFHRRARSRSEFFIARGKLGPATVGLSFSATQISGSSYMGAVGTEKLLGYGFSPAGVSSAAAPWFSYILLGDRLRRVGARLGGVTLADIFAARYYSKTAGLVVTLIMLAAFVPMIAAQLKAGANVFEAILGLPYWSGLVVFGGIVVFYTSLGGMYAVAWSDFVQGIIMIAGFAILAPVAVTRFLIPEDDRTLRGAMAYSVVFQSFIYVCATLIAIASGVLLPDLEKPDLTVPTLVARLLPPVVGAIIVAAALAAIMSTLSSILLLSGSLMVENVFVKFLGKSVDDREGLRIARRVTFIIGAAAVLVAVRPPAAIFWIVTIAFSLLASAFTFPFLLGLWWPRATKEGGIAGMLGGAAACVLWYVLGYLRYGTLEDWIGGIWPALLGPLASLLLVVAVSELTAPPPDEVTVKFFDD